jgi:hypothetical protein
MGWGSLLSSLVGLKRDGPLDERFRMHQYKSTRLAVLAGALAIYALFLYDLIAHRSIRWDLAGVLVLMAAVKIASMLYYRRTN